MKKAVAILFIFFVIFAFAACGNKIAKPIIKSDLRAQVVNSSEESKNISNEEKKVMQEKEDLVDQNNDEEIYNEPQDIVEIDLSAAQKELIASTYTLYNPRESARTSNIKLAGSMINGTVIYPNQEFSFNNIVGKRTTERGFLPAPIFVNNGRSVQVVDGVGGGICQMSSTICGSVKETSMEILERNLHSKRVAYTTVDKEAMISWGVSDFRFKNTYEYPIMLEIFFEVDGDKERVYCNIYSLN